MIMDYLHVAIEVVATILSIAIAYSRIVERLARLETKVDLLWVLKGESKQKN